MSASKQELPRVKLPFKCVHGASDTITCPVGSQLLHDLAGTAAESKSVELLPELRHEVRIISYHITVLLKCIA